MSPLLRGLRRSDRLADYVPWLLALDDELEIIMTAAGGLMRTIRMELPDFESESPESLLAHHDRLVDTFKRYGAGWSIWLDQWRVAAPGYLPESRMGGNATAYRIDRSRHRQFTSLSRPVFQNTSFLSVHYTPQARDAFLAWLMDRDDPHAAEHVAFFKEHSTALIEQLKHTLRGGERLSGDKLASYLSSCVTYNAKRTMMPIGALAPQLATREWHCDMPLRIEDRYVATVEIRGPGSPSPLTCEMLHELDFEARWCTTLHGLNAEGRRAELGELRKRWRTKQKGLGALLTEIVTRNPFAGRTDPEVDQALLELDVMQRDLPTRPFALAHSNVHVWADEPGVALDRAGQVASLLKAQGMEASVATLNNVYAPLADMPGNVTEETRNVRRARLELGVVTRIAPVTGVSTGSREDARFGGPALLAGLTRRGVPFYWSINAPGSDRAHTAIVGTTGAGKSSLIALMVCQFLRYAGARVIVFDRRRSFMVTCLALGGNWIELGGGNAGVQPLRAVDRPAELAWAQDWVMRALRVQHYTPRETTASSVARALGHVADLPPDGRTLTALHTFLADEDGARRALRPYLRSGPYGNLFDGVVASYGEASVMGIETQDIIQLKDAAPLTVSAVFRAMQRDRLTGDTPKLVIIDEAWSLLQSDLFAGEIESWAREMRKLKAALVLASQSLADFATEQSRIIFDQIANRIFLPHAEAMRPQTRALYEAVGLLESQIKLLTSAQPKGEYLLQTEQATRLVQIRLEDEALAICGSSTPADHARAWSLLADGAVPGPSFTEAWLGESTRTWLARQNAAELQAAE